MLLNKSHRVSQNQECFIWSRIRNSGASFTALTLSEKISHNSEFVSRADRFSWDDKRTRKQKHIPSPSPYPQTKTLSWRQRRLVLEAATRSHTNDKFIVHVWSESLYSINTNRVLHWAVSWLSGAWQWGFCPVGKWCHILSGLLWMHQHFPPHRLSAGSAAKNMSEQQFIGEHRKLYWVVRQICP